jgi:hypothetical protein
VQNSLRCAQNSLRPAQKFPALARQFAKSLAISAAWDEGIEKIPC